MKTAESSENDLEALEVTLTSIVAAILQKPNRVAGTVVGVAASKLAAAGIYAGAVGAIGAFGAASTGTAIATLSGAAATTATLYWVGSMVGLGVAAGGTILAGGALVVAIPATILVRRKVFGRPRVEQAMTSEEQALLYAALRLAAAVRLVRGGGARASQAEKRIFAREGLAPLSAGLRSAYLDAQKEDAECATTQPAPLALWPRERLRQSLKTLDRLTATWTAS
jgi:hypothetical protein